MGKFKTSQSLAQQKMVALPTTLALLLSLALILAITLSQVGVVSAAGTLTVAQWAYGQGLDSGSRAWVQGDSYELVDDRYVRLLS